MMEYNEALVKVSRTQKVRRKEMKKEYQKKMMVTYCPKR